MVMVHSVAITLLRHGLTEANERREYLGWTDSPLSERGRVDIQQIKGRFSDYEILISSDLQRCVDTAKLLFPKALVQTHSAFREMNWGRFEGKTYEQLKEDASYQKWLENPMGTPVPEGESYPLFSERVESGWQRLLNEQFENMAIITHGGVIRELLVRYAPEEKLFWDWDIPHAGGYELVWDSKDAWRRGARCTSLQVVPIMGKSNG
jgi:alpha-ribazole phosphatase